MEKTRNNSRGVVSIKVRTTQRNQAISLNDQESTLKKTASIVSGILNIS
jgi:hypothetical protein